MILKKTINQDFSDENKLYREDIFDRSYQVIVICFQYTYKAVKIIINTSGIYLIWIFLHYLASHLYVKLCVPSTFLGFLLSPFMTATPHCQGLRWIVYNAANMISNMWIILGAWICSILVVNHSPLENQSFQKVEPN